jgi:hypothetical protein
MARSMADKQWDAAHKVAGDKIEEELYIYETSVENWVRLVNFSDTTTTAEWMKLYESKGFKVEQDGPIAFFASKRSLVKADA